MNDKTITISGDAVAFTLTRKDAKNFTFEMVATDGSTWTVGESMRALQDGFGDFVVNGDHE